MRDELLKHGDVYDGFLASIRSALKDLDREKREIGGLEMSYSDYLEIAEKILKRIIGEE